MASPIWLVALALTSQAGADGPRWHEATSKDGAFTFAMPAKPVERTLTQPSPNGLLITLEYSCRFDDCLYRIERIKSPVAIPDDKVEGALAATRDDVAQKTKLLDDKATTVAGWPAREMTVEAPLRAGAGASRIAMLLLYADNNFYQVRVFALRPGTPPKNVRRFFDAFKPTKARASKPAEEKP